MVLGDHNMEKKYKLVNGILEEFSEEDYKQAEIDRLEAIKLAEEATKVAYKEIRKEEYGSIESQLDMIYHKGIDAWKAHVATVKANNPKPSE